MNDALTVNWMWRYDAPPAGNGIKDVINELNDAGYYSSLFTVHSKASDYVPKLAYSFDLNHKIKYMIAFRPYLLSPQYFKMLIKGFDEIQQDRVLVNLVHGQIGDYENFDGIMDLNDNLFDSNNRRKYLERFVETLNKAHLYGGFKMPECLVAGGSPDAIQMAARLGFHSANGYDSFIEGGYNNYSNLNFEKIFIQVSLLIRDTDEEANEARNVFVPEPIRNINIICGSPETVLNKLKELQNLGATDILVSNSFEGGRKERQIIHDFVSEQIKNGNLLGQQD